MQAANAAASPANHAWVAGVITMGLPQLSEIAWRWSDFTSWITKKDADEPSVRATDFLAAIAPLPLVMIQSSKDEYVPEADYRLMDRTAGATPADGFNVSFGPQLNGTGGATGHTAVFGLVVVIVLAILT
mgnify:CR=1 FL=1